MASAAPPASATPLRLLTVTSAQCARMAKRPTLTKRRAQIALQRLEVLEARVRTAQPGRRLLHPRSQHHVSTALVLRLAATARARRALLASMLPVTISHALRVMLASTELTVTLQSRAPHVRPARNQMVASLSALPALSGRLVTLVSAMRVERAKRDLRTTPPLAQTVVMARVQRTAQRVYLALTGSQHQRTTQSASSRRRSASLEHAISPMQRCVLCLTLSR